MSFEEANYIYKTVENKLENMRFNRYTELWDDCLLPLLDAGHLTEEQAEFAVNDEYLFELIEQMKIESGVYEENVIYKINEMSEHEKWYRKSQILK